MRLRTALIAAATTIASVVVSLTGLIVPATAAGPPVITAPANGGTLLAYSTGPLVIEASTAGTYSLYVRCQSARYDYAFQQFQDVALVVGTNTIALDTLAYHDGSDISGSTCTASIGFGPETRFTIVGAPLELSDLTISKPTFYPLVKDGYLDFTKLLFDTNRGGSANVTITDAKNRVVYNKTFHLDGAGRWYWAWNGKTTSGKPVLPGKYRATLAMTTDGVTQTRSVNTTVATKMATRRWTIDKGSRDGRTETSGKCRTRDGNEAEGYGAVLDCRGGKFAAITYTLRVPANATNIRYNVKTTATEDDFADRGTITKTGKRISDTKYQIRVQVTGYRATVVDEVSLTYKARVQI